MNRRGFLGALAAALVAPRALLSLFRRPSYEGMRLVKSMGTVEMSGEVMRRWRSSDDAFYSTFSMPSQLAIVERRPPRPPGSFAELERRIRVGGWS